MFSKDVDDLPTVPEIFEQMAAEKKASLPSRIPPFSPNPFVDAEAIHSGDDASEDEPLDQQQDDYDYEDSFIDDSRNPETFTDADDPDRPRSRRSSVASSMAMDLDEPFPGVHEDNPVDVAMKERARRVAEHEQEMAEVLQSAGQHKHFLLKTLQLLKSNNALMAEQDFDEGRQLELATRESLMDLLFGPSMKRESSPPRTEIPRVKDTKGKGKALPDPPSSKRDLDDSDSGLSDYERRDRKRLRTGLEMSRRHQQRPPGESSNSTPSAVPPDSDLKPQPHREPPNSVNPQTPTRTRRKRKAVAELVAEAGATPTTPSLPTSTPPASTPTQAGLLIESRLLPPPPENEVFLDMSDHVIRMSAPVLYHLARILGLISWNENLQGPGHVRFAAWAIQCPNMDGGLALAFIIFKHKGSIGNLSRMDLSPVYCLRLSPTANRYHAVTKEGKPFTFLTSGFLEFSQITAPSPVGLKQRSLKIITHEGEQQRLSSAACTVFGFQSMKTQYAKHALQFSSRAEYSGVAHNNTPSPGGNTPPAGMFTGGSSSNSARISTDSFSLPNTAEVPVYDATNADDFDVENDIGDLEANLPRWRGEIPYGSFTVVGYTMTAFLSSSREWTLGLNIQWAIVVGIPDNASG